METRGVPGDLIASVDHEFEAWERLRRRLVECESRWADAVTASTDAPWLAALQRESGQLRQELDEAFGRAMRGLASADKTLDKR